MRKPKYPNAKQHKRVSSPVQEELENVIGSGNFLLAIVMHKDGSIDTFANYDDKSVKGPTEIQDNQDTGQWEEPDGKDGWKPFDVKQVLLSQSIQVHTVLRNPICKVITYPDGTKVCYCLP